MLKTIEKAKPDICLFESVLQSDRCVSFENLNNALNAVVKTYGEEQASEISSYISRRVGIAEWIIKYDLKQRYEKNGNAIKQQIRP